MGILVGYAVVTVLLFMTVMYVIAQIKRDNSIVDIGWGLGFVLIVLVTMWAVPGVTERQLLVAVLVSIWGIRLASHIYWRGRGKGEDYRYVAMRKGWGNKAAIRAFFRVFMLQGVIMLVVAYPLIYLQHDSGKGLSLLDGIGAAVWLFGFLFEAVGDYQLLRFVKRRKRPDQIMTEGLWRYTRHPNYFGEALLWWGVYLIICSTEGGWMLFYSPVAITFLLLKISGIPLLEKKYAANPAYQAYKRRTNAFIPWLPKSS